MNFFDEILERKLIFLVISLIFNCLLFLGCGYLLYSKFTYTCPKCECQNNLSYNDDIDISNFYVEINGDSKLVTQDGIKNNYFK